MNELSVKPSTPSTLRSWAVQVITDGLFTPKRLREIRAEKGRDSSIPSEGRNMMPGQKKGMTSEAAMEAYIDLANRLLK